MTTGTAVAVSAVTALAVAGVRAYNLARARRAASQQPVHAAGADGVFLGAEAFTLRGPSRRALLLLHGFNDTSQSVAQLAHALHERGWTVVVPLLPDHGRGADHLAAHGRANDWINTARLAWRQLRAQHPDAALAGQSMGGALAVILAETEPPSVLVLLAPYLSMGTLTRLLAMIWPIWQIVTPKLLANPKRGLRDPEARARALGNSQFSPRMVHELWRVVRQARRALSAVRVPTLVFHARGDYRIPSASATRAFSKLGAADKTLVWRENSGHILAADSGREEVYALMLAWLDDHASPRETTE